MIKLIGGTQFNWQVLNIMVERNIGVEPIRLLNDGGWRIGTPEANIAGLAVMMNKEISPREWSMEPFAGDHLFLTFASDDNLNSFEQFIRGSSLIINHLPGDPGLMLISGSLSDISVKLAYYLNPKRNIPDSIRLICTELYDELKANGLHHYLDELTKYRQNNFLYLSK